MFARGFATSRLASSLLSTGHLCGCVWVSKKDKEMGVFLVGDFVDGRDLKMWALLMFIRWLRCVRINKNKK